jgi:hypothetical protein
VQHTDTAQRGGTPGPQTAGGHGRADDDAEEQQRSAGTAAGVGRA